MKALLPIYLRTVLTGITHSTFHRHRQSNEQAEMIPFVRHMNNHLNHLRSREQARVQGNEPGRERLVLVRR